MIFTKCSVSAQFMCWDTRIEWEGQGGHILPQATEMVLTNPAYMCMVLSMCVCAGHVSVYCVCSEFSQLLFLFMSLANICCSCVLDAFRTECLLRGLPGVGSVPACRRRAEAVVTVTWAGLLSAERLLWMKLPPPCGYCSVSRVEEEKT